MDEQVERRAILPAPPDEVWQAVTAPEQLPLWFGAEVELELEPGGAASFRGHDGERRRGIVEHVEPGRRLVFRWWPLGRPLEASTVTVAIEPRSADETEVVVTEHRIPPAPGTGAGARFSLSGAACGSRS